MVRIAAWKFASRNIDPFGSTPFRRADDVIEVFPNLCGHRDVGQTGCPGNGLYKRLPELRARVAELIRRSPLSPQRERLADALAEHCSGALPLTSRLAFGTLAVLLARSPPVGVVTGT